MRAHWMHLAAIVTILSLLAGCVSATPMQPPPGPPTAEARPLATQPPATQAPPTQPPATRAPPTQLPAGVPSTTPSPAAPAADLLGLVKAFEDAYNRHDVDATAGLLGRSACMDWGAGPKCGRSEVKNELRYDGALNSELEISDCRVEGDRVTCRATERNDCLAARGLNGTHDASVDFTIQDGKITYVTATKPPEDAQRDLLFFISLTGWAHRARPSEYQGAGLELDNNGRLIASDERTGAAISALCKAYAAVAAAAPAPNPTPPRIASATGAPGRVLFIGDSSSLGLDGLLPKLAASGQPAVTVASKLDWEGGIPFWKQYEFGHALDDIRQGKWDVVVLQDDLNMDWPGRAAEFYEYGRKFDQAIKQAGAETVFYMVYPYQGGEETTTEEIAAAYSKLGQDLGDKVAPAALAFQRSLRERPDLDLYSDGIHPNSTGSYLIGCVLYATIFGRSPIGLAHDIQGAGADNWQIPEKDAADLQRIAWETVQDYQAAR
jgi:hypothetical protein